MPEKKSSSAEPPKADSGMHPPAAPCAPPRAAAPFLGHGQAVAIVCASARTIPANLARTLAELGLSCASFQQSVRCAVTAAGYTLGVEDVPAAPGTRLIQVVTVIQNARRTA